MRCAWQSNITCDSHMLAHVEAFSALILRHSVARAPRTNGGSPLSRTCEYEDFIYFLGKQNCAVARAESNQNRLRHQIIDL